MRAASWYTAVTVGWSCSCCHRLRAEENRVAAARRMLLEATGDVGAFVQALDQITGAMTTWEAPAPASSPPAEPQPGDPDRPV